MSAPVVWFNKNLSSLYNVIETIREAARGEELRVIASHTDADHPASAIGDAFETEPRGLVGKPYIDYCLDFAQRHGVTLFAPGKELRPILRERERFEAQGVRLLSAADADTHKLLESKSAMYEALEPGIVNVPGFRIVSNLAGFDAAIRELSERYRILCYKPTVGTFGLGFRVISSAESSVKRLISGEPVKIGLEETRSILGQSESFQKLMVMQYLAGPERSVDCLGHRGELVRCVVRRKGGSSYSQYLEDNPQIVELTRRLTARFGLNGVYNVQFRDHEGETYLLEINTRMSGGLHYSCLAGVAFPYWAIRLELGTAAPADVPWPVTGRHVGQVTRAIWL